MSFPAYAEYKDSGVPWLGAVPNHWERNPLFALVQERDESNTGMQEDNLLSLSYGQIKRKNIDDNDGLLPASFETYQIVERDDIIWRLTDLQNDQRSLRTGIVRERGIITSAYLATRPTAIEPEFLAYLLRAYDVTKVFYSMGGGLRQSMKFSDVKWLPVMLPSTAEQGSIITFLDRETEKIDALVAEQERLIALLKEKRQVVISHTVTKGLNPNAPMKDSGIEWLGEVPSHWEVASLKRSIDLATSGPRGWSDLASEEGSFFFQSQNIGRDMEADFSDGKRIEAPDGPDADRARLHSDDVAVCITGGRTGAVAHISALSEEAYINQHVCLLRPSVAQLCGRYLAYGLFGLPGQEQLALAMYGLKQGLSLENVREVVLPLPPVEEQRAIAEHLDQQAASFGALVNEAQSAITLLQERRAALIFAAVTGKIDVRGSIGSAVSAPVERVLPSLRAVVGGFAVLQLGRMGRMAVMKGGYLAEAHCGLSELGGRYERYAAGPYDSNLIAALERGAAELCGVQTNEPTEKGDPVTYAVPKAARAPMEDLRSLAGEERAQRLSRLLADLSGIGRDGVEAVATLYAVWNDLLAADRPADDDAIFNGVLTNWHDEKARKFKRAELELWIAWMRRNGAVPDGTAPRTDHQGNLFA
ncbi:restriction endonuclease subunit S [Novosphingobium sp.]|uniref:restriction endonuclease subunit S n=1 Tax=Novosphingobium sp. TaxID=1874826 RepID=UPI00262835A0|nr:restriction endonuclease subunit S [Novosphingobium sp.]